MVIPQVAAQVDGACRHGRADTEAEAIDTAKAAVVELADGRPAMAVRSEGTASHLLKTINAEARKTRPSNGNEPERLEHLYGIDFGGEFNDFELSVVEHPIVKRTAKRIYYVRHHRFLGEPPQIGYVDRQEIEQAGADGVWSTSSGRLYLDPPELPQSPDRTVDLKRLKAEMAAAHPDVGGDHDEFIAARTRYERAMAGSVRS